MAEALLKIGTVGRDPAFQDGDVIEVITNERIRLVHASHICDVRKFGFTTEGLRPDSLAKTFYANVCRYRFDRISLSEVRRTELGTSDAIVLSDTPHLTTGERIDVAFYLDRRLQNANHLIFGVTGSEVWYGGFKQVEDADLDIIWAEIEAQTAFRESDFTQFPRTRTELRSHLAIPFQNVSRAEAKALSAPTTKTERIDGIDVEVVQRKRDNKVDWRALSLPRTDAQIEDRSVEVDVRDEVAEFPKAIVDEKDARSLSR